MEEDELVCDECGTLNDPNAARCDLCGDPLGEERESRQTRQLFVLLPLAVVVTAVAVWGGAVAGKFATKLFYLSAEAPSIPVQKYLYTLHAPGGGFFWLGYILLWAVALVIAPYVEPKDEYDLGNQWGPFWFDRPFDYSDDRDRMHFAMVTLLMPVRIVRQIWLQVFDRLAGRPNRYDPDR